MIDIKIGFKADNNTKGIARSKKLPIKLPNNKSIPINFGNKYGYKRTENNIKTELKNGIKINKSMYYSLLIFEVIQTHNW